MFQYHPGSLGLNRTGWTSLYQLTGHYGNQWQFLMINVQHSAHEHDERALVFEAKRGDGYLGDMAIDDVVLYPDECEAIG